MADRWRRPRLGSVVLGLSAIAFFVALGVWQLRRAHEKVDLFAAFDGAAAQAPVDFAAARAQAGAARYPHVRVSGHYDPLHAYVLDNQVRDGRAGVMVFGVFDAASGGAPVLVNRGFLARGTRGEKPQIPPPPEGAQTLDALYAPPPGSGLRMGGDALPGQAAWPKIAIYMDLGEIGKDLGRALDPRVLLLLPGSGDGGAFVREWRPDVFPPERHYGYALTWFTFAAVVVATFAILHRQKRAA